MKLLRVVEINKDGNTDEPVNHVCYHPVAIADILKGKLYDFNGELYKPICCAVEYEDKE